jgi:hypothetical protein
LGEANKCVGDLPGVWAIILWAIIVHIIVGAAARHRTK